MATRFWTGMFSIDLRPAFALEDLLRLLNDACTQLIHDLGKWYARQ